MDSIVVDPMRPGALRRGLHILNVLRNARGAPRGIADIAKRTGLARPTVYRLLATLEEEGFARRDGSGKLFLLASPDEDVDDQWSAFVRSMVPMMQRIARQTGNACFLVRPQGGDLLCLHREIGTYPIQILSLPIGGKQPLGVGAAGIALLAAMGAKQLAAILKRNAESYAAYGNLHPTTVLRLVENCQARGYSVVGNYSLEGVLAVGVSITDTGLPSLAAMSVTAPLNRMPVTRQKELAQLMQSELKSGL